MKRVLLPTDFSENSNTAIDYAISLFSEMDVEFILLNSYTTFPVNENILVSVSDILESNSQELLKLEAQRFKKLSPDNPIIELVSKDENAADAIVNMARNMNADLIVMGTKGANVMKNVLFGSVTAAVSSSTGHPLLVIPEKVKFNSLDKIAIASDYGIIKNRSFLGLLKEMALSHKSKLLLLHVEDKAESASEKGMKDESGLLNVFNKEIKCTVHEIKSATIIEGLDEFISTYKPDLIAMMPRHQDIQAFGVTQTMMSKIKIPLLLMCE